MKLTMIILLGFLMQVSATVYSQATKFSLNVHNKQVVDVLKEIEDKSDFRFFYQREQVDVTRKVDIKVTESTVEAILDQLFENQDVSFNVTDNNLIIIRPEEEKSVNVGLGEQQRTISGKVTDKTGIGLPGVSVVIKGTTTGTITDANGNYSLSNIPPNAIVLFSFVGMKPQQVKIEGQSVINIVLQEDSINIDEVVAVGYGTMRKDDLTGSVSSINMDGKEKAANVNLTQALQGYIPGVNAGASRKAGEEGSLSIRGRTSLSASDNPLIVLDGIIYNGSISDIDVNDVEKIDILKDASAAAVYGSRSANGVVLITTKKGKSEKPIFNFNMYYGFQDIANTKRTDVMNGDEYAIRMVDYYYQQSLYTWYKTNPTDATNRPVRPDVTDRELVAKSLRSAEEQENYLAGREIDWVDEVTRTAPIQNYNLSVSGKTDRTNYFLSASYTDQTGVMINDQFTRSTLRANFENKITNWFTLGFNTSYSHLDYSGLSEEYLEDGTNYAGMYLALVASPLANMYDASGKYPTVLTNETYMRHPLGNNLVDDEQLGDNLFTVLSAKVDIPKIKGLRYEINYSNTFNVGKHSKFYPATTFEGSSNKGLAIKQHSDERNWLVNNIVSYNRELNKHKIGATLLYSRESRNGSSSNLNSNTFGNPVLGYNAMQLGENKSLSSGAWEENTISYMARATYGFDNKYLLTATFRRDGFSGFGANNKYTDFPSVSVGWVVSEESFLKNAKWLDLLKFRLSHGTNGNQGIGRYSSLARMGSNSYTFNGGTAIAIYPTTLGNADLGWETTASTNLGMDFKIFDHRISAEVDVYNAETSDVLVNRSIPTTSGYSSVWTNIGGINNKGLEVGLTTVNVKHSSFKWESRFQFSINRDKITKLYGGENDKDLGNSWFVGKPISSIYNYYVDGVWQEEDLFNKKILANYYPGQYKLRDLNGDGVISASNDRDVIGYGTPNYRFSVNNSFSLKGFVLSVFINSIQGGDNYYLGNAYDNVVAGGTDQAYRINRPAVRPYWRPDNAVNNAPGMFYSPTVGHGVYESKSFIRLQDVSLSYNFNKNRLNNLGVNDLQIYLSGKNLYTWTKWSGWDPEISGNAPMMRSVIAGVKLSF
jgi:TonB-linked SusC/RagA family outer membrane protein